MRTAMTYTKAQLLIDSVKQIGDSVSFYYPESMSQAVVIINWGLLLEVIRKTGTMPGILVEAVSEFFQKVEDSQAA
jgi:hypothetical protein